ncbi:MAG: glutathione S-transferase family protein [Pseudomonadales bacterium]|nr:glutathione S-transferase family protein [Pseudomonadales bacterium]
MAQALADVPGPLEIHGITASRTLRTLWMAEELGIEYVQHPVHFQGDARGAAFTAINPNGRVPAIVDDGVVIWESMAINLHLARTRVSSLTPDDAVGWSQAEMWSFWVMTECEGTLLSAVVAKRGLFGYEVNEGRAQRRFEQLSRPLGVLERHLLDARREGAGWLLGGRFTVADLNVASVLSWLRDGAFDLDPFPAVDDWLSRCLGRDAFARARAR